MDSEFARREAGVKVHTADCRVAQSRAARHRSCCTLERELKQTQDDELV
jgi:hypothetical protein